MSRSRVVVAVAIVAVASSGCSVLLDWDLAGGGDATSGEGGGGEGGGPDDGAAPADAATDGGPLPDDGSAHDGALLPDGGLDCVGAQLCDDFEGRTDPRAAPRVGAWSFVDVPAGSDAIDATKASHGILALRLVESAATGFVNAYYGSALLPLGATRTVRATFDVRLDLVPSTFAGDGYRLLAEIAPDRVGTLPDAAPPDYENAGLYYDKARGAFLRLRVYDGANTATDVDKAVPADLRASFHHVVFEARFSTTPGDGYARVTIDGLAPVDVVPGGAQKTLTTASTTHTTTIGASASDGAGPTTAYFDDVVLRSF